ncbi:MAG: PD-(D/E)XK nuclease family protein [Bacilli bacterium]
MKNYRFLFTFDYLIIPPSMRQVLLRLKNEYPRSKTKFLTKSELFAALDFAWTPDCEIFLYEEKKYHWNFILTLKDSLHFLLEPEIKTTKVKDLIFLKKEMQKRGLLVDNPYIQRQLAGKQIGVIGYLNDDCELALFAHKLNTEFTFIPLPEVVKERKVARFAFVEDEVAAFFNQLGEFGWTSNADLKRIKLLTPTSEYDFWLQAFARLYQVPINLKSDTKLIAHPLIKKMLEDLSVGEKPEDQIEKFIDYPEIQRAIINTLNDYPAHRFCNYPNFLKDIFSTISLQNEVYEEAIELVDDFLLSETETLFVLGFNEDNFPRVQKDDSYLNDGEKRSLGRLTSKEINLAERAFLEEKIKASPHVIYSFADKSSDGPKFASNLIKKLNFTTIAYPRFKKHYSPIWAQLYGSTLADLHDKYGENAPELPSYQKLLQEGNYRSYQNQYQVQQMLTYEGTLWLSYSKVNTFFQCPFHYYLDYILKIGTSEDSFNLKIGYLIHRFLQRHVENPGLDYDEVFDELVQQYDFTLEEKMFLPQIKHKFSFAYDFIKKHEAVIVTKKSLAEKRFEIKLKPNLIINGAIDRTFVLPFDEKELYVVIDYKTGKATYNEKHLPYGQSLQLPTYALLLSESTEFATGEVIGLYIQNVLDLKVGFDANKTEEEYYQNVYHYVGISVADLDKLQLFDPTYEKSQYIKSLQMKKGGGFYKNSIVKSSEELQSLAEIARDKFLIAEREIRQFNFPISPLKIGSNVDACKLCPYRNICYRKSSDYRLITLGEEQKDEIDTLESRGENDGD